MDEFELIERYFARGERAGRPPLSPRSQSSSQRSQAPRQRAVVGIGDDCAVIRVTPGHEIALSTDMLVEGRHFLVGTDPERLGHKALAVNLSDCAANGALPRYALLAMALPDADEEWLAAFSRGLFALADRFDVELIGGDTTRGPLNLCVTIVGEVPTGSSLLRSGACVGDVVWVSGRLGSAAIGLGLSEATKSSGDRMAIGEWPLSAVDRRGAIDALETPEPRVTLGIGLRGIASAAIDVSDGLVGDLKHILERSHVGAEVFVDAIPCAPWLRTMRTEPTRTGIDVSHIANRALLAGGDDYELCFTAAPSAESAVLAAARNAGVEVASIGRIVAGNGLRVIDSHGRDVPMNEILAYDHFR